MLAAEQHGAVSRAQCRALGLSPGWIARAIQDGRLHVVSKGVYAVGHPGLSRRGRGTAALLHAGAGAVLSHESAARTWGIIENDLRGLIHVSVRDRRVLVPPAGVVLHRPRTLGPADATLHRGVPVTTLKRTLVDLLPGRSTPQVVRLLEQLVTVHNRSPDELHEWASTLGPVRGRRTLMAALDDVVGPVVLRSKLESEFRTLCQRADLPLPETNVRIGPWEVDAVWHLERVIVELDSWRFHGGHWQFHRDRTKGLALARDGYEVLRLTWRQVSRDPHDVAETLRAVLARRTPTA